MAVFVLFSEPCAYCRSDPTGVCEPCLFGSTLNDYWLRYGAFLGLCSAASGAAIASGYDAERPAPSTDLRSGGSAGPPNR